MADSTPQAAYASTTSRTQAPVQTATAIVSALFVLLGVLGFIPGATMNYESMTLAGYYSEAMLLGIFKVSVLHNIVHLLFGVVGFVMMRAPNAARAFLIGGGVIYLLLWLYGLVIDVDSAANFLPLNSADNWLHLGLAFGMVGLGTMLSTTATQESASQA